jgi:outer membrane protein TolC
MPGRVLAVLLASLALTGCVVGPDYHPLGADASAVLLGQNPGGLIEELQTSRPHMRQAERSLAAATARIGIQVASPCPSITLTGQYGSQSGSALTLVAAAARYYSLGPQIT